MPSHPSIDEELVPKLPLPLAQLYRRAQNAKSDLERHLTALYLWEAGLKLLASTAIVNYARQPLPDPRLTEELRDLARPALGHWWKFVRLLVPVLADAGDPHFAKVRDFVLGRARDDLPRLAGLDVALRQQLTGQGNARATVRCTELFERLVEYRNKVVGHAAPANLTETTHARMADALLAGLAELFSHLDVLAGRKLIYVSEVRQSGGVWLVQRLELAADGPRRLPSLELPRSAADKLPDGQRLYLESSGEGESRPALATPSEPLAQLCALHTLVLYEHEEQAVLFLNARRKERQTEYLCYTSGQQAVRRDLGSEQRELLARVLGMQVSDSQASDWAAKSLADEPAADEPEAEAPRMLGEFELLSELGRGGMGAVYRAWQPSLRRQVALKQLLHLGDAKTESRFRREIRALGKVEHPSLVKIFTAGSDGQHWFYAMELVEGALLSSVCDRLSQDSATIERIDARTWQNALSTVCEEARRKEKALTAAGQAASLPIKQQDEPAPPTSSRHSPPVLSRQYVTAVVELVRQAAEAAHALHEQRIIHRDIKPGNIMVTADGSRAVLMDLGLAQLADEDEGRLTRTRQFVGTLRYASPEQVLAAGQLDRRSDVYSLGATLWELLALRPIYAATEATPTPVLMQRIMHEEPERLSRLCPTLPRDLDSIVQKCLEKRPESRYPTAQDLAADLSRLLHHEPVLARPITPFERGLRWAMRHQTLAAAYALLVLAILLTILGSSFIYLWTKAENALTAEKTAKLGELKALTALTESRARQQYCDMIRLTKSLWDAGKIEEARQKHKLCSTDYRNWEWHYLNRLLGAEPIVVHGRAASSLQESLSPDGTRLVIGGYNEAIKLCDAITGNELAALTTQSDKTSDICFSPDGRCIAALVGNNKVKLWDGITGKEFVALAEHKDTITCIVFNPVAKQLATAGEDGKVRLWDIEDGALVCTMECGAQQISTIAFSPDGRRLASAGGDNVIRLWDVSSGEELVSLANHDIVLGLAFSPDGERLLSGNKEHVGKLWNLVDGKEICTFWIGEFFVPNEMRDVVAFSPDGRRLASVSNDGTVRLRDGVHGNELSVLNGHRSVSSFTFSPDDQQLATISNDGKVKLWQASEGRELRTLSASTFRGEVVLSGAKNVFSPDGQRLAATSEDGTIRLWNSEGGKELYVLRGNPLSVIPFITRSVGD